MATPKGFGRRADGTIKRGYYLDCQGRMRTAGKAALRAHKAMGRSLARGTSKRRRRAKAAKPALPPRPSARQRRAVAAFERQRQGTLF